MSEQRVVAAFADEAAAERARAGLVAAGVADSAISVLSGEVQTQSVGDQVLGAFMSLFGRNAQDAGTHTVAAGHVLVVVGGDGPRDRVVAALEAADPVAVEATEEVGERVEQTGRVHILR